MVKVTRENIAGMVQTALDSQSAGGSRLVANLFIRRSDGSWVVRVEPDRDDAAATEMADRLVEAEERLATMTDVRIELFPVIVDELGLIGAEIVKTGV